MSGRRSLDGAARLVSALSIAIAAILGAAILLILAAPNLRPFPVPIAFSVAQFLAGPFDGLFVLRSTDAYVFFNWGLAAVIWLALGQLIAAGLRAASRRSEPIVR